MELMTDIDAASNATRGAGGRIREARREAGLTQVDLARSVGVSRSAVAQWETNRSGQVNGNLARIAHVLGVSVEFLLTGQKSMDGGPMAVTATELALLRLYRSCGEEDQAFLLRTARRFAKDSRLAASGSGKA